MKLCDIGSNQILMIERGNYILCSYNIPVAAHVPSIGYFRTTKKFSKTTTKHINNWLDGINAVNVAQDIINSLAEDICDRRLTSYDSYAKLSKLN